MRSPTAVSRLGGGIAPFLRRAAPARRGATAGGEAASAPGTVRSIAVPLRPPRSPAEDHAFTAVRRAGAVPFSVLVQDVADRLYRDERRRGGWVLDLGLLGAAFFTGPVAREIRLGHGELWHIDTLETGGDADRALSTH